MANIDSRKGLHSVVKYTYNEQIRIAFHFGYKERIDEQLGKQNFNKKDALDKDV